MTIPLCYYGSSEPLPPRRILRAGPLSAVYEAGDLRSMKIGGVEVCRRWYAAVRDQNWGTVPGVISDEVIEETDAGFRVTYTSTHRQREIHFVWRATIIAAADRAGTSPGNDVPVCVEFRCDGDARSRFRSNRIGFCVLHPPNCAGTGVCIDRPDGEMPMRLSFPQLISPDNPFLQVTAIRPENLHQPQWTFEGDVFEMEDQRNWIDASFKTFCTPLDRPFPVQVETGDRIRQIVRMEVTGCDISSEAPLEVVRCDHSPTPLPAIGLGLPEGGGDCSDGQLLQLLSHLRPAHVRVEVNLDQPDWLERLKGAAAEATSLGAQLELAVNVSDNVWEETALLIEALHAIQAPLIRVMAFHAAEWTTPEDIIVLIVEAVARYDATVDVFIGSRANFAELNRSRPALISVDGVCYSVHPQEHAFDNASLIECCSAIGDTVCTARSFAFDKLIAVGPITLRKRVNPYATQPGWQPPAPDPRQGSLFGAGWTLGALKYLAESGAAVATFYETTGPRGVAGQGGVFPLFHVLADANEWPQANVVKCESTDPLRVDALFLEQGQRIRVMLANMTSERQMVSLGGLCAVVAVRILDETSFDFARTDPVAFRRQIGETRATNGGRLILTLNPYAYVCIDG